MAAASAAVPAWGQSLRPSLHSSGPAVATHSASHRLSRRRLQQDVGQAPLEGGRLHRMRRLAVRYDRRADMHYAFLQLGCCLVLQLCPYPAVLRGALHEMGRQNELARVQGFSPDASCNLNLSLSVPPLGSW